MSKEYFTDKDSVVREIWGNSDTIFTIFAGASAEFALNKAVDWLYFTGRLPSDPIGRFLSTVSYARRIIFSEKQSAMSSIAAIKEIHKAVEAKRGVEIQDWAFRDVLFMLIDYSIRSYEILKGKMDMSGKQEVFNVFLKFGKLMEIPGLPASFKDWEKMRQDHLQSDLECGHYTRDLFRQYRIHLGPVRYRLLLELQIMTVPEKARELLSLRRTSFLKPLIPLYKMSKGLRADKVLKSILLPARYSAEIKALDSKNKQ